MKVNNLDGLQDGGSRVGQSVSILMNWRTGFEKRSQYRFGPKRANSGVTAHSSPGRLVLRVRKPLRASKGSTEGSRCNEPSSDTQSWQAL